MGDWLKLERRDAVGDICEGGGGDEHALRSFLNEDREAR
jgi:hypothetical protein